MVSDPSKWSVFLVPEKNRIYDSFGDCVVRFYEYLFTRLGLWLPFPKFKKVVLKNFKFSSSELYPGSWEYVRILQLCVELKSCKTFIGLFLDFFQSRGTFLDNFRDQGILLIYLVVSWCGSFTLYREYISRHFILVKSLTSTT